MCGPEAGASVSALEAASGIWLVSSPQHYGQVRVAEETCQGREGRGQVPIPGGHLAASGCPGSVS